MIDSQLDQEVLSNIAKRVMFDSVAHEVDMSDPKAKHDLVEEVVKAIVGSSDSELIEKYVQTVISDMYRDEALDEGSYDRYRDIVAGAKAAEQRNRHIQ